MNFPRLIAVLLLAGAAGASDAAERRYSIGLHDFAVPDVDSHTYVDHDKDDLDPDHIPIWWRIHLGTDGDFWHADATHVGWTADVNTRMNTVSSVERQILAFPAITARYDGRVLQPSLKAGAGWFFLEIDDDVPKTRGYDRDEYNLDIYQRPDDPLTILPRNDDLLIRLSFSATR